MGNKSRNKSYSSGGGLRPDLRVGHRKGDALLQVQRQAPEGPGALRRIDEPRSASVILSRVKGSFNTPHAMEMMAVFTVDIPSARVNNAVTAIYSN